MDWELENRKERNYPPFGSLLLFRMESLSLQSVKNTCNTLLSRALSLKRKFKEYEDLEILGPTPSSLFKLKNKYRYNMLIKSKKPSLLKPFGLQILETKKWIKRGVKVILDRDPYGMV